MRIHPTVAFVAIKNLLVGGALYYWVGEHAALWWAAFSAVLYGLVAVNGLLLLEEKSGSK